MEVSSYLHFKDWSVKLYKLFTVYILSFKIIEGCTSKSVAGVQEFLHLQHCKCQSAIIMAAKGDVLIYTMTYSPLVNRGR